MVSSLIGVGTTTQGDAVDRLLARCAWSPAVSGSHNRTLTVGSGFAPDLLSLTDLTASQAPAGLCGPPWKGRGAITAGGDFHPALRTRFTGTAR